MAASIPETVYEGRFLKLAKRGRWEYATRTKATGVVAVIPMHDDGRVVLIEQYRPPIDASVIELPAGLVGDEDDSETLLTAAKRELEEETGYTAAEWIGLGTAYASPGLTDEAITFFLARGLTRTSEGGGVGSESITVHEMAIGDMHAWLSTIMQTEKKIDMKLLAGLYKVMAVLEDNDNE